MTPDQLAAFMRVALTDWSPPPEHPIWGLFASSVMPRDYYAGVPAMRVWARSVLRSAVRLVGKTVLVPAAGRVAGAVFVPLGTAVTAYAVGDYLAGRLIDWYYAD